MKRKTVDVEYMKSWVNTMLMGDDPKMRDFRLGIGMTLEEMLHRSGNYKGYRYLDLDKTPVGMPIDHSRREYF